MSTQISEDTSVAVKDLIKQLSGFEEGTDAFNRIQKYVLAVLKKSDSMYFLNKKEVDRHIDSMSEKFIFHGFFPQAKGLEDAYKAYIPEHLAKSELTTRLNIVKFLLCMSEKPTIRFLEKPEEFVTEEVEEEEEIDWGEYLNEGIEKWSPNFDDTSVSSNSSMFEEDANDNLDGANKNTTQLPVIVDGTEKDTVVDLRTNREELLATIQHTWYSQRRFYMAPFSDWREANIGILWDNFLEDQVKGLVPIEKTSVLSEYKVIREILWQLWNVHTSAVFELDRDKLKPKSNVTISSVRGMALENFLYEFIPYIEVLEFFREFSKSLEITSEKSIIAVPPTFRSYNSSLENLLRPVYRKISELENLVREQETTYTLLKLARNLQKIFEPVFVLKKIHDEVVIDIKQNSHVRCATVLLSKLHYSLQFTVSKLEQDLRVTLFLESLYHYFTLIDSWLVKDDLSDYSGEFLIVNKNRSMCSTSYVNETTSGSSLEPQNWRLNFELRDGLDDFYIDDGIIKIIRTTVLQIGRNLHFLRLLGKFSLIKQDEESIHQEFIRRTLEGLCKFFHVDPEEVVLGKNEGEENVDICEANYKYPVVCTDQSMKPTEWNKLENLVETSDGFLMLAFKDYLIKQTEEHTEIKEATLFEKVSKITTTMFPVSNFFEKILNAILEERFTVSGLMVKNMLIERYLLERQFQFLRHTFLFFDDLIFPFYRNLFEKTNTIEGNWGNSVWLTSRLQDVLMDVYPEFYENCLVQVKDNWRQCTDSLDACNMLNLQYKIQWPLNIVITPAQMELYKGIFQFVLKIKWALYTVNHLAFTDLEPRKRNKKQARTHKMTIMKLKYLKFVLTNVLNSIQHYVFSFVFTKCLQTFELSFEKANDLTSIIISHADFVNSIYGLIMNIKNCGGDSVAFKNIINCVNMLKVMWHNVEYATPGRLNEYYKIYNKCSKAINPIICPVYIFDY